MWNAAILYHLAQQYQTDLINEAARDRILSAAKRARRGRHTRSRSRLDH